MKYRPDEATWMAYLYGELEGAEKEKIEQYLTESPEAREQLARFQEIRGMLGHVEDKEVIAPPIVIDQRKPALSWNSPYIKMIVSMAASLLLIIVAGKLTDLHITVKDNQLTIAFGEVRQNDPPNLVAVNTEKVITSLQVQEMINESLQNNNQQMQANWDETRKKLDSSIKQNLSINSARIDELVRNTSSASQDEIRRYVTSMQSENLQMVKDYFQLTSSEQKQYIEDLLVDFAKYLQQQRNDDFAAMQTRLNTIEQNTNLFKKETEQILTSIISNSNPGVTTIKY